MERIAKEVGFIKRKRKIKLFNPSSRGGDSHRGDPEIATPTVIGSQ